MLATWSAATVAEPPATETAERFAPSKPAIASKAAASSSPPPRKGLKTRFHIAVVVLLIVAGGTAVISRAAQFLIVSNARPSDLILVLAGDDGTRLEEGLRLLKSGLGKDLLIDADASRRWLGLTEADRLNAQLTSTAELAPRISICPIIARSTLAEAKEVGHCLHRLSPGRILIVTSASHTRRALSTFRRAVPQYEWVVTPVENPDTFGTAWWSRTKWVGSTLREWEKLVWWEAVDRWRA